MSAEAKSSEKRQAELFPALGRFVLWCRPTPRSRWRVVGSADTGSECLAKMDDSGIAGGDWMMVEGGKDPNESETATTEENRTP